MKVKKTTESRYIYGNIFKELRFQNSMFDNFKNYMRMPVPAFYEILSRISLAIECQDTRFRTCIPTGARLEDTLSFLITYATKILIDYK